MYSSRERLTLYGVYAGVGKELVRGPVVLHKDYRGWWAPLDNVYYSSSSKVLVSRHPEACVEEIVSYYCPQCMTRYQEDEVLRNQHRCQICYSCPLCAAVVRVMGLDSTSCAFSCGYCGWSSTRCGLTSSSKPELENEAKKLELESRPKQMFKKLLSSLQAPDKDAASDFGHTHRASFRRRKTQPMTQVVRTPSPSGRSRPLSSWCQEDLEAKMAAAIPNPFKQGTWTFTNPEEIKEEVTLKILQDDEARAASAIHSHTSGDLTALRERLCQNSKTLHLSSDALPIRVKLRHKLTKRCRKDRDEEAISILVQHKAIPTEGDSSVTMHKGKWWWKDACAVHFLPKLLITVLPKYQELSATGHSTLSLKLYNPFQNSDLLVTLHPAPEHSDPDVHPPFVHSKWLQAPVPVDVPPFSLQLLEYDYEYLQDDGPLNADTLVYSNEAGCIIRVNKHMAALTICVALPATQVAESGLYEVRLWFSFAQRTSSAQDQATAEFDRTCIILAFPLDAAMQTE